MSFTSFVRIYHGPCNTFDIVEHKPQKLRGLKVSLQKRGYRVVFEPVNFINYCMIEMCGHEIFRCNMKYLCFNTVYERDIVCQRAVKAVEESAEKFRRSRHYLWFWDYIENDIIFMRSKCSAIDTWPSDVKIESFAPCIDCIDCCGILTTRVKETPKEEQSVLKFKQQ